MTSLFGRILVHQSGLERLIEMERKVCGIENFWQNRTLAAVMRWHRLFSMLIRRLLAGHGAVHSSTLISGRLLGWTDLGMGFCNRCGN